MSLSIGSTISFDIELLSYLPKLIRDDSSLGKWVEEIDLEEKKELAADAIIKLIRILGFRKREPILTKMGYPRIRSVINELRRFEGLLHYVYSRYSRKIYRDHLDHMLRTALVSSYLASFYPRFPEYLKEELVLAALFHDAGYPLQEAGKTLELIGQSVKPYKLLDLEITLKPIISNISKHIRELSRLTGISARNLFLDLKVPNHSTVAAAFFLDCGEQSIWKVGPSQRIASAICLHHSPRNSLVHYDKENPLPLYLTLADELQDWGRHTSYPIGFPRRDYPQGLRIPLPKLEVSTGKNSIDYILKYKSMNFPFCEAIRGKYHNLKRIRSWGNIPRITLHFSFERVSSPLPLNRIFRSFFKTIKFLKRGKWTFHQLNWRDVNIAAITGLKSMDVYPIRRIRRILSNMNKPDWHSKWKVWQYEKSGNFLVSMTEPKEFKIVEDTPEFKLKMQAGQANYISGSLIKLNDPVQTTIPPILRTVPAIVNVLTYILRREERFKRINQGCNIPEFRLDFEEPKADIFWFKPSSAFLSTLTDKIPPPRNAARA